MVRISTRGLLLTLAVFGVATVCITLGFWQLDRLEQRRRFNAEVAAASDLPPIQLDSVTVRAIRRNPSEFLYRRMIATGEFESTGEVLLRGRSHDGRPGVHLVTPFRLSTGDLILVNRGWLPSPDAATLDPRPYRMPGKQNLSGSLQILPETVPDAVPLVIDVGDTRVPTYRRLDHAAIAESGLGADLIPRAYLQLSDTGAGAATLPIPVPPPALDDGPHLGYAIQWFSFAAIAVLGYLTLLISHLRRNPRHH